MVNRADTVTELGDAVASLQFQAANDIMDVLSKHPDLQRSFLSMWKCVVRDTERLDTELLEKMKETSVIVENFNRRFV